MLLTVVVHRRVVACLFCVASCKGGDPASESKPTQSAPTKPEPAPTPAKPDPLTPPFGLDHTAAVAKLQGVWLVKGFGVYGAVSAWRFDGAKVTVYDPIKKTERPDVLLFESPCAVRLDSGDGGTLVIDGDDVYLGLGMGGFKQGDTIIACMHSGTVYSTPAGCTTWKNEFGTWSTIETTCSRPEGRFVATEKSNYGEGSIRFWNDRVLLSDQLHDNKLAKQRDWDGAKAAADKLVAAKK